jgi:hypothetical protein
MAMFTQLHWDLKREGVLNITRTQPNTPDAGNAGIASQLAIEHHWPGVPEPDR